MIKLRSNWVAEYSYDETIEILTNLALAHATKAGPYANDLCGFIRNRDWDRLVDYELAYDIGADVESVIHARQALGFFQKLECLKLGAHPPKEATALKKFVASERNCSRVNERFRNYRCGVPMGYPYDVLMVEARKEIHRILAGPLELDKLKFRFGPGAQTNVQRGMASPRVKLGEPLQCSHKLEPFSGQLLSLLPALAIHHASSVVPTPSGDLHCDVEVQVVPGRLQFVSKNAKTYRSIIIEPGMNVLFQQGIAREIRTRFRSRTGINLNRQADVNRLLASRAEELGLATVDFVDASSNIARCLVHFLIPENFGVAMDHARTDQVEVGNGLVIPLEMYSSMGNSFTFELESVIFYALAKAVCKFLGLSTRHLTVFGDDLIIPRAAYPLAELLFSFCGFKINPTKSFSSGPFYESCGCDYYNGVDVRPFYQKLPVSGQTLFALHNHYMRTLDFEGAERVMKYIHPDLVLKGPDGYGDGHLVGSWDPVNNRVRDTHKGPGGKRKQHLPKNLGWCGGFFVSYRELPVHVVTPHTGDPLLPVYSIYVDEGSRDDESHGSSSQLAGHYNWLMADWRHFVVPGTRGYTKTSIYTLRRGIFRD